MKAVILAAGKGERMGPLTLDCPKPLLKVAGKPILDHIFSALPDEVDEVVLVVKYLADKIKGHCGNNFYGKNVVYAEGSQLGTAYSFLAAKPHLENEERFLFIYGDEIPAKKDIEECLRHTASILCWEVLDPWNHGVVVLNKDGSIKQIVEKPDNPPSKIIADGVMVLSNKVFQFIPEETKGEFYFTTVINQFVDKVKVMPVMSVRGIGGISTPDDIKRAEKRLKK